MASKNSQKSSKNPIEDQIVIQTNNRDELLESSTGSFFVFGSYYRKNRYNRTLVAYGIIK